MPSLLQPADFLKSFVSGILLFYEQLFHGFHKVFCIFFDVAEKYKKYEK